MEMETASAEGARCPEVQFCLAGIRSKSGGMGDGGLPHEEVEAEDRGEDVWYSYEDDTRTRKNK